MEMSRSSGRTRYGLISLSVVLFIGGALGWRTLNAYRSKEASANYTMTYPSVPSGWKALPHGPQTLFLYQHPKSKILICGAVNQVIDDINPTPELGTDSLAKQYVDVTRDNMQGWSASLLDRVGANGTEFRLIRRSEKGHVVVDAFAVRGNTTVLISLSGRDQHVHDVDDRMDQFRAFLSNVKFTRADMSNF
ncbi:MAG: hypothetical protein P4L46_17785 [Fimbriimonas sp.]|nr:hypothetical protein [Fimbriimonas sp.]